MAFPAQNFRRASNRKYLENLLQGEGAGVGIVGVRRAEVSANLMGEKTCVMVKRTSIKTNMSQIKALHSLEAGMIKCQTAEYCYKIHYFEAE